MISAQQGNFEIARAGRAVSTIVVGNRCSPFLRWVAEELRRYVEQLSGADLAIATTADAVTGPLLLIGSPEDHLWIANARQHGAVDFSGLSGEGYLLKSIELPQAPALIIGGGSETGTMYAVYELLERLGVVFQLTGDIIPQRKSDVALPPLDLRAEPALKYRGLHVRHFVMPEMGLQDFRCLLDQLAKLKCNYLEFYWYVGAPWINYRYRGESKLIGDLNTPESGYTCWRSATGRFTPHDVLIGRDRFTGPRACAPEFQQCRTPDEAYAAAAQMLNAIIDYAHQRKIQVWLGKGDCPCVPPNLGRHARYNNWSFLFGRVVSPGDPAGMDIWTAALQSMIENYPQADGYWLWLAELYFHSKDPEAKRIVRQYEDIRKLIPRLDDLRAMGYDQYFKVIDEEAQVESDIGLLHYARTLIDNVRDRHPDARLGVSLLGRSYLFPALDALLPKEVALQSMEASVCWNRSSRVPMENFATVPGRETFLVPRLDDDESELAMQFNVDIYAHDRVVASSNLFGLSGVAPQSGRTRGLEQNFRFLADGGWNSELTPAQFYRDYVKRTFGEQAAGVMGEAYRLLEENEHFLGLGVNIAEGGHCFQGLGNFVNYADSRDIGWLKGFRKQAQPLDGPDFPDWHVKEGKSDRITFIKYRHDRFQTAIGNLKHVLDLLDSARELVLPGAQNELAYLVYKTESYHLHLEALCALMEGHLAYDAAFHAKLKEQDDELTRLLDEAVSRFTEASARLTTAAEKIATLADHPDDRYILFRYNTRFVQPVREFGKFIRNIANYYHGQPYWEPVEWGIIDP